MLLPFQKGVDESLSAELNSALGDRCKVPQYVSPMQLYCGIASADYLVGMRLHSLIMAQGAGTGCAAISYDPKIDSFAAREGIEVLATAADITADQIVEAVETGCGQDHEKKDYAAFWQPVLDEIAEICGE